MTERTGVLGSPMSASEKAAEEDEKEEIVMT